MITISTAQMIWILVCLYVSAIVFILIGAMAYKENDGITGDVFLLSGLVLIITAAMVMKTALLIIFENDRTYFILIITVITLLSIWMAYK